MLMISGADEVLSRACAEAFMLSGLVVGGLFRGRSMAQRDMDIIMKGALPVVGEDFFRSMARHIAGIFRTRYAFVGLLGPDERSIETIALWSGDDFAKNIKYALKDTPCERALFKGECFHPRGVARLFPKDKLLVEMEIEGYSGFPIRDADGAPLGLAVIMDTKPMRKDPSTDAVLDVFVERASQELGRIKAEREKEKLIAELRDANARIGKLKRLLPICASCMKIRDDRGGWQRFEEYIKEQSGTDFSHGICPECSVRLYGIEAERLDEKKG